MSFDTEGLVLVVMMPTVVLVTVGGLALAMLVNNKQRLFAAAIINVILTCVAPVIAHTGDPYYIVSSTPYAIWAIQFGAVGAILAGTAGFVMHMYK